MDISLNKWTWVKINIIFDSKRSWSTSVTPDFHGAQKSDNKALTESRVVTLCHTLTVYVLTRLVKRIETSGTKGVQKKNKHKVEPPWNTLSEGQIRNQVYMNLILRLQMPINHKKTPLIGIGWTGTVGKFQLKFTLMLWRTLGKHAEGW